MINDLPLFSGEPKPPVNSFGMRDYQEHCVKSIYEEWESAQSTLIVLPTGCGKTVVFSETIKRNPFEKKILVLAHREELIFQAKDKIEKHTGFTCDVEMADRHSFAEDHIDVVVSSIQTQNAGKGEFKRMNKFNPDDFSMVIIDEAHHAPADSYRRVIDYYRGNDSIKILGVTATPDRADEEALGQIFETVAFDYDLHDAIRDGWLVPIDQQCVVVKSLDFSSVKTTAGDLNGRELAEVMEDEEALHGVCDPLIDIVGDRKTLVFASSVFHAERMCEIFNRHKEGCAEFVCGKTDKDERRETLIRFADNDFQFLTNVGCFTEGFDDPGVEVVAVARPTKSRSLYAQMVGRGTRTLPGVVDGIAGNSPDFRRQRIACSKKNSCLVVDFVGNAGRHKLVSTADILGGNYRDEVVEKAKHMAEDAGTSVRMEDLLEVAAEEIKKIEEARKRAEEAKRKRIKGKAEYSITGVNPFDVLDIEEKVARGWDRAKRLSAKQQSMLEKNGINVDEVSYTQGKQIIDELFTRMDKKLATFKQVKLLKKNGYQNADKMTFQEASDSINELAANGWKRPR